MSDLKPCPFCGGEMRVRMHDEDFYKSVFGTDYECDPEYKIQHVDRLAVAKTKCPLEMVCYKSEAEAIAAWNTRDGAFTREDVEGAFVSGYSLGTLPVGSDPQWDQNEQTADEHMAELGWVRERTCQREKHGVKMDGSPRLRCSLCGYGIGDKRFNYCPNCGARIEVAE